ncbi:MAG: AAA family ATPase [Lacunisphaera sp.]
MTPRLIFLAGPNGAGKSTLYEAFLQDAALDFVNADRIAGTLGISNEEAAAVADHLRNELLLVGKSFIAERFFSDPVGAKLQFLRDATDAGYQVTIYFIGLASPALSAARVWQQTHAGRPRRAF